MSELEISVPRLLEALGIEAKQRGSEWKAICPLPDHDDHDPSWTILDAPGNDRHANWRCYGCSRGGGPVGLVRRVFKWESVDGKLVRAWLAENAGDVSPRSLPSAMRVEIAKPKVLRFRMPAGFVDEALEKWPGPVKAYALSRGITDVQRERWGIGYALEGRLEGRLVLPVRDYLGNLTGYHARTFTGALTRYLTPAPEEGGRATVLFGEAMWPDRLDRLSATLALSEGGLDALALERAGARYVAALSGGGAFEWRDSLQQLAPAVAHSLSGWGKILLALDNDDAGIKMAGEIDRALGNYARIEELPLPYGVDCCAAEPAKLRALVERYG